MADADDEEFQRLLTASVDNTEDDAQGATDDNAAAEAVAKLRKKFLSSDFKNKLANDPVNREVLNFKICQNKTEGEINYFKKEKEKGYEDAVEGLMQQFIKFLRNPALRRPAFKNTQVCEQHDELVNMVITLTIDLKSQFIEDIVSKAGSTSNEHITKMMNGQSYDGGKRFDDLARIKWLPLFNYPIKKHNKKAREQNALNEDSESIPILQELSLESVKIELKRWRNIISNANSKACKQSRETAKTRAAEAIKTQVANARAQGKQQGAANAAVRLLKQTTLNFHQSVSGSNATVTTHTNGSHQNAPINNNANPAPNDAKQQRINKSVSALKSVYDNYKKRKVDLNKQYPTFEFGTSDTQWEEENLAPIYAKEKKNEDFEFDMAALLKDQENINLHARRNNRRADKVKKNGGAAFAFDVESEDLGMMSTDDDAVLSADDEDSNSDDDNDDDDDDDDDDLVDEGDDDNDDDEQQNASPQASLNALRAGARKAAAKKKQTAANNKKKGKAAPPKGSQKKCQNIDPTTGKRRYTKRNNNNNNKNNSNDSD